LLYFTENALKESELCIGRSSWVEILCPSLICTLKSKKTLKLFLKKPRVGFFPALGHT